MLLAIVTSLLEYSKQHLAGGGWPGSQESEQEGREVEKDGDIEYIVGIEQQEEKVGDSEDTERGGEGTGTVRFGGAQNDRQAAVVAAFRHAWKVGWGLG